MTYKRLIPILLIKDGLLVRSQLFQYHQAIGDPIPTVKRLSDWNADEIVILNIGLSSVLDSRREDKWHNIGKSDFTGLVRLTSTFCFAPLSVGGGIRKIEDFNDLFEAGADKCIVNTALFENPEVIKEAVSKFGSQAVVASIDIGTDNSNNTSIFYKNGTQNTGLNIDQGIEYVSKLGVGEILISSIDRDGSGNGYDPRIISQIPQGLSVPLIINSGPGRYEHFSKALETNKFKGLAASNIFYFTELSYPNIKRNLIRDDHKLRNVNLDCSFIKREPNYEHATRIKLLKKANHGSFVDHKKYDGQLRLDVKYCSRCLYPSLSATPMQFDNKGLCMGCRVSDAKRSLTKQDYATRKLQLLDIVKNCKTDSEYDCIVSVSGGKDSYYQTYYVIKELGLKPLLVTYNGNNYSKVGWRNLLRMRECFNCDHLIFSPSISILKKLNKLAFVVMGDMNWHGHMGIFTTAPRIAIQQKIPLIFWGEHGYADLCGQFSMQDFPEMNYRERTEHAGRGFDWNFFVGLDGISIQDMNPWKYPSDKEIFDINLRQIYLGHYIEWDSNKHLELMIKEFGFEVSDEPFERTYRTGSNLDDIHENGVHDYLKYIKFGYGRCTDHVSKDIRSSVMTRKEGIKLVNQMDPIKPKDIKRWLEYVSMKETDFDRIADHFRDPRVWEWSQEEGWKKTMLNN
ncbi:MULTISPECIES: N-acetyl sugar amidotransferase [Prochlorococcus]|uniref:N-acetyl sugar amidotransferase n=1 Tax=Prochlorococcus TaxID=1218 RepID=UPI000533A02C|nr:MULTISPECIES: N-acetyl sugar amidotransferase [Prochlorococcus]KGG12991.1 putative LPS biosynthesis protein [Prochlorococcus sp. MIT 0601]